MLVANILKSKAIGDVLTVKSGDSISSAAAILSEKRIGALIVSDNGKSVDGILSERDIVREIGQNGVGCMSDCVRELMTKSVIGCTPKDSVISLMGKMTQGHFRHMPVLDDGVLVGVVSIGDVVKARIDAMQQENSALTDMLHGKV